MDSLKYPLPFPIVGSIIKSNIIRIFIYIDDTHLFNFHISRREDIMKF